MGMFDYIRFEDNSVLPRPDNLGIEIENLEFQTKSLDNILCVYFVGKDGRLYQQTEKDEKQALDFHGIVSFGAYETTDLTDHHLEYEAKFTDGILQNVSLIKYDIHNHDSRKARTERLKEERRLEDKKISRRLVRMFHGLFKPLGMTAPGVFRTKNSLLTFHLPKIILGRKKEFRATSYGISLDKLTTEIRFSRTLSSREFSFKLLGVGFEFINFEDFMGEFYM